MRESTRLALDLYQALVRELWQDLAAEFPNETREALARELFMPYLGYQ